MSHSNDTNEQKSNTHEFDPRTVEQSVGTELTKKKKKSKCHGNQKLQRFKRKWRARGLVDEEIQVLIQTTEEQQEQMEHQSTRMMDKRKRDPSSQQSMASPIKSLSQLSLTQRSSKRRRAMTQESSSMHDDSLSDVKEINLKLERYSKYLRMPRKLLLRSIEIQLNRPLKTKDEQHYILRRLQLIDEHFCVQLIRNQYQSYCDLNSSARIWPAYLLKKVPTDHQHLTGPYVEEYLTFLNEKVAQYEVELQQHRHVDPSTMSIEPEMIDRRLHEFVRLHHVDLMRLIQYQINRFRDEIEEKRLSEQLEQYSFNMEHKESMDRLTGIRDEQLKVFEQMILFQQRILCHRLPRSFNQIEDITDQNDNINVQIKTIQEAKRRKLNQILQDYELKLLDCEHQYQDEWSNLETQLWKAHYSGARDHYDLIMQCLRDYLNHQQYRTMRTIRYREAYVRTALRKLQRRQIHEKNKKKTRTVDVYPQVIVDTKRISLNQRQLEYLSQRGPNYIRPNQSYLYPDTERDKLIKQQYESMINVIVPYLVRVHHIPASAGIIQQLSEQLKSYLCEQYKNPISYLQVYRTRQELRLVQSIRLRLKRAQQILRVTDKGGIFHIGDVEDYERKAEAYRMKTQAYQELDSNPLPIVLDKVVRLLNDLRAKKQIMAYQLEKMMPKRDQVALAYLYFIPKPHKEGTPLRPIVSSIRTPTSDISKFLDRAIRPLFDKHARSTTIIDGVDLIRRLQQYENDGHLKPTTHFCTFDITDLYTMLPQEESLDILTEFLLEHGYQQVKGIPIDAIRKLAKIVIEENVFVYGGKYYRQIVGGAMGSPFTLTLANIFMWKWEKQLAERQQMTNEIYGRYIDDIFITSNESLMNLNEMLDKANSRHPNIKLVRQIGKRIPFLDVLVENQNGILATSVYHKTAAEPYIVPFSSDHPRHIFANIIETQLLRAIRYSSTSLAFDHERRSIQLLLLYNGYPSRYVDKNIQRFFSRYLPLTSSFLVAIIDNAHTYYEKRSELLAKPTPLEQQMLSRIASIEPTKQSTAANKQNEWKARLIVHYDHEQRLTSFKKSLHRLWKETIAKTPIQDTRLIVGNRNTKTNKRELIHYRPRDRGSI